MSSKLTPENKAILARLFIEESVKYLKRKNKPIADELLELAGMKVEPKTKQ